MYYLRFSFNYRCEFEVETSQLSYSDHTTVFNTEAFRYASSGSSIYVECRVRVCLDADGSPQCTSCPNSRRRRDITDESAEPLKSEVVSVKSPIFYIIDKGIYNIFTIYKLNKNCYFYLLNLSLLHDINRNLLISKTMRQKLRK